MTWSGNHRPALDHAGVYPRPVQDPLPVWVAVGGSPESVVRAGTLGLPLTIAIIGGQPERFAPLVELYREAGRRAGHDPSVLKLAINTHAFLATDVHEADAAFMRTYLEGMNRIGRERGWPPSGVEQYRALRSPRGALAVGSPEEIAEKILFQHELFGHDRYLAHMSLGAVEHRDVLRSMELFGTQVAPRRARRGGAPVNGLRWLLRRPSLNACRANDDDPTASGNIAAPSESVLAVRANSPPATMQMTGVRPSASAATRPRA